MFPNLMVISNCLTDVCLCEVPEVGTGKEVAEQLRKRLPEEAFSDPQVFAETLKFEYHVRPIGSPGSEVQAVLVPMLKGGFRVVVNQHKNCNIPETLWLLGHEFGHTLFYSAGSPPTRVIPCSSAEEKFCDAIADELFGQIRFSVPEPYNL